MLLDELENEFVSLFRRLVEHRMANSIEQMELDLEAVLGHVVTNNLSIDVSVLGTSDNEERQLVCSGCDGTPRNATRAGVRADSGVLE